jgi:hypothetical protein
VGADAALAQAPSEIVAVRERSHRRSARSLLSLLPGEALRDVTWSYSRRSLVEQCPLRYYFEYYGSKLHSAPGEPLKQELRFLKTLASRHERTGSILHLVIAKSLKDARANLPYDEVGLIDWARKLFWSDVVASRSNPDGGPAFTDGPYPPVLLREYHYRSPEAERQCIEAGQRLVAALKTFFSEPRLETLRTGATSPQSVIEGHVRLDEFPCGVEGRIDLAFRDGEVVTVVDWKLGRSDGSGEGSLQLAAYALWATGAFTCTPDAIRVCKAHLSSGEVVDFRADDHTLSDARARILQDAELMLALDPYGRDGRRDAFSACSKAAVCRGCPFQRACPAGKEYLDA